MNETSSKLQESIEQGLFLKAVKEGLSEKQKSLPTSYLYDARGSELFEEITMLDEYYQARTEIGILNNCISDWAESLPSGTMLVEFGSGSSTKTEIILSATQKISTYVPIDVSEPALANAENRLKTLFPSIKIIPLVGDFSTNITSLASEQSPRVGFFPGSTIGNWRPDQAKELLRSFASILGRGSQLLIGVDLVKDPDLLIAAYDDANKVTASFNLNILKRINRELNGNFNLEFFKHSPRYNSNLQRIEMHLQCLDKQLVRVGDKNFSFYKGETIHTENSYKYTVEKFRKLVREAGWSPVNVWTDADNLFSVHSLISE
ncbi:MAG: Histidine N-alpha-methyltransferase [Hyphomicrobiaceae bacterium hypho_1]